MHDWAIDRVVELEGGYVLSDVPGDLGRQTFAGISRKYFPDWVGWRYVDKGEYDTPFMRRLVKEFYEEYARGLGIGTVQQSGKFFALLDFGVLAGKRTMTETVQRALGGAVVVDGELGPKTLHALDEAPTGLFLARFALGRIEYHAELVMENRSQSKFFLGWVNRALHVYHYTSTKKGA